MHVLVGYVIDGKSNGIDKYLLHMLDVMKQGDISFDFLTNHKTPELEAILKASGRSVPLCESVNSERKV